LTDQQLGCVTNGTSFADIIINCVGAVADGQIQGFAQFVHDPISLKTQVQALAKQSISTAFAEAVTQRKVAAEALDNLWDFPFNMQCSNTTPTPWTFIEATVKSQTSSNAWEFNIMRTIDFIGRNFVKITLPAINTSNVKDSYVTAGQVGIMQDPQHTYLGAWHTDLIPRLIESLEFYTRSNSHKLFEYSGYDIFIHNLLFGNAHKEMNDILAGEDKFELCYDPYRVDGSAMGLASFKGVDAYVSYTESQAGTQSRITAAKAFTKATTETVGSQDGFIDYFQLDTTMDDQEFRDVYRHNVWYEAPVARNYWARHSIHSRRMFHQKKDIVVPLDILPFGYSIGSSLPTASIASECGFIKIKIFSDWLDRCFYLTKLADVPSLHPLVNHTHYGEGDYTPEGQTISAKDPRLNWVNERSLGRYGDPGFVSKPGENETLDVADDKSAVPFSTVGSILNTAVQPNRENIIPTNVELETVGENTTDSTKGEVIVTKKGLLPVQGFSKLNRGKWSGVVTSSTTNGLTDLTRNQALSDADGSQTAFIHKLSTVDSTLYSQLKSEINVKLIQVGYQTLPCIREYFSKLPNIYITTEWKDEEFDVQSTTKFEINNDLYIQAIVLWAIPTDANGIRSLRVYPCHMIDHEYPLLAGIKLINEQSQGETIFDWTMLNVMNPAQMNLNPLIENIGLISFSPSLKANEMPYAFYDTNIASTLKLDILKASDVNYRINLKQGVMRVINIGVNGVANVNLSCYRLIF